MKKPILFILFTLSAATGIAQELFVATEPASNMPGNSVGFRLTTEMMDNTGFKSRFAPEIMVGVSKNLMLHTSAYFSNMYQSKHRLEGWGASAKYRFLTVDNMQRHFRGAVYGRYSKSKNPVVDAEINLDGDDSGIQGGIVFTQLLHRLALSGSGNYTFALDNSAIPGNHSQSDQYAGYSFSAGYLVHPKTYENYNQPNLNLYMELLGKSNTASSGSFMEYAPAVQLILNSTLRIDLSKRFQLWGNMNRYAKNMYLVRLEYNFFNAW